MGNTLVFFNCPDSVVDSIRNGLAEPIPTKYCDSWDDVHGLITTHDSQSFVAQLSATRHDLRKDLMQSLPGQGTLPCIERHQVGGFVSDHGSQGTAKGVDTSTEVGGKLAQQIDECERRIITETLHRNRNHRNQTAAELGISRVTLYNKMKKFDLL